MAEQEILPLMNIDFTPYRLKAGDTIEFITKMNATQELIETWGQNLGTYGELIDALLVQARDVPAEARDAILDLVVRAEAAKGAMESFLSGANLPVISGEGDAGKVLAVRSDLSGFQLVEQSALATGGGDLPALPEIEERFAGKVGANWEDANRGLYEVAAKLGRTVEMLGLPSYNGLQYGSEVTVDGKSRRYIKLCDAAKVLEGASTFAELKDQAVALSVIMLIGDVTVENLANRGTLYGDNYKSAGVVCTRYGSQSTMEGAASGLLLGGSGYSYKRVDLLMAPEVEMFVELDSLGAHLFIYRTDEDYSGLIRVFGAGLALPKAASTAGAGAEDADGLLMYTPAGASTPVYRPGQLLQRRLLTYSLTYSKAAGVSLDNIDQSNANLADYFLEPIDQYSAPKGNIMLPFTPKGTGKLIVKVNCTFSLMTNNIPTTSGVYDFKLKIRREDGTYLLIYTARIIRDEGVTGGLDHVVNYEYETDSWVGEQKLSLVATAPGSTQAAYYRVNPCYVTIEEFS